MIYNILLVIFAAAALASVAFDNYKVSKIALMLMIALFLGMALIQTNQRLDCPKPGITVQ